MLSSPRPAPAFIVKLLSVHRSGQSSPATLGGWMVLAWAGQDTPNILTLTGPGSRLVADTDRPPRSLISIKSMRYCVSWCRSLSPTPTTRRTIVSFFSVARVPPSGCQPGVHPVKCPLPPRMLKTPSRRAAPRDRQLHRAAAIGWSRSPRGRSATRLMQLSVYAWQGYKLRRRQRTHGQSVQHPPRYCLNNRINRTKSKCHLSNDT